MANNSGITKFLGSNIVVDQVADELSGLKLVDVDNDPNIVVPMGSDSTVRNPEPLPCFMPQPNFQLGGNLIAPDAGVETMLRRSPRKRQQGTERKQGLARKGLGGKDSTYPLVPLEKIPALMKYIEERNGTRPVFLYGKELEQSDVCKGQNRLFVNKREKFEDFFTFDDLEQGEVVKGVDGAGDEYELGLVIWKSLDALTLKKEWRKLVEKYGARKGHWVQIWGFRAGADKKPCLTIDFVGPN